MQELANGLYFAQKDVQNVVALQLIAKAVLDLSKSQAADLYHNCCKFLVQCFLFSKTMSLLVRGLDKSSNPGG